MSNNVSYYLGRNGMIDRKFAVVVCISVMLQGCASTRLDPVQADMASWGKTATAQTVSVLVYSPPALKVKTPGDVAGAGMIDALTKPDSTRVAAPIPSYLVAKGLARGLSAKSGVPFKEPTFDLVPMPLPERIEDYRRSVVTDYVLEVSATTHQFWYRPLNWATYQYWLVAHARLIDVKNAKIVWAQKCEVGTPGVGTDAKELQLTSDEFGPKQGQKVRDIIALGAKQCTDLMLAAK
jgi:hypothetical protein